MKNLIKNRAILALVFLLVKPAFAVDVTSVEALLAAQGSQEIQVDEQCAQKKEELDNEELKKLSSGMVNFFLTGAAFAKGGAMVRGEESHFFSSMLNSITSLPGNVFSGVQTIMDYLKKGTAALHISKYVGSYGDPESAEALWLMQPEVSTYLQAATVAKTATVVGAAAITLFLLKKIHDKVKKA